MRPQDAEITTTQGRPVVKNSKGWIMSGGILLRSIRLAALVVVEIWAATGCLCAMADDAVDAFPPELVKFDPIKANLVFQGRGVGNWDEHIRERGWILRDGDKWQMWYTGFEGGGGDNGPNLKLGYATSSDGLQWSRYPGNPVYDESWVEDMMVVKRLDTYYMFAEGQHDIAQLLTSTDGIHWTLVGPLDIRLTNGQPISAGPRGTPTAYYENDSWYLFYERRDLGIWLATSKDTKVWTNVDDEPVIKLGPNEYDSRQIALNQIVKYKGRYYAYYHGSGNEQPRLWSTNVAVSNDLVHWVKYRDNPLLPIEDNKSSGILVDDGKQFRLYTMHDKVEVHFPIGAEQTAQVNIQQWDKGLPSDPNFFPIAVWLQAPKNAERYRQAGINLYVGLWKGPTEEQLRALRSAAMPVICAQNQVGLSSENADVIVGWMHGDEPDNAQPRRDGNGYGPPILPAAIVADYQRIRQRDLSRPVLLNLGQGVAFDQYIGRGVRRNHPEDYPEYIQGCDIVSFDIYPAVHDNEEVAGKLEFVPQGVERLRRWSQDEKIVWNCIECSRISNTRVTPTPHQIRAEVWMSLIHGSRGLIYFVHQFEPTFKEASLLDDPELLPAVTAINQQIRGLAAVLNSPTVDGAGRITSSDPQVPIAAMCKRHDGALYVFAVGMRNRAAKATIEILQPGVSTKVEVLGEDRSLEIRDGRFEDEFEAYAVHLFRLVESD
jgi:hypothetical protein